MKSFLIKKLTKKECEDHDDYDEDNYDFLCNDYLLVFFPVNNESCLLCLNLNNNKLIFLTAYDLTIYYKFVKFYD